MAGRKSAARHFVDLMKVEFVPLAPALLPACAAFNQRLRRHGEPLFVLPEELPQDRPAGAGTIAWSHHVAVDESGAVRGGVLLMEQRGWLGQEEIPLLNIQSPLSEGIVDRTWSGVGLRMLQFLTRRNPRLYAVGMGSGQNPFARLLTAAGWDVRLVPFQFAVIRPTRFLREIGSLREGKKRTLAQLVAASGLGAAANAVWRLARPRPSSRGARLESTATWPQELDAVWEACRNRISFSSVRDARAAVDLYPESRVRRYVLRAGGDVVGWSACLVTPMQEDSHFGNLVVGTILDAMAPPHHLAALLSQTKDALSDQGADLIVVNQTHAVWREQSRQLGFFNGPSNYLLASSKRLKAAVRWDEVYVTRGDGDGRINL